MLLENCKLKQKWDTTTHLVEWPKFWSLTTPNADEDVDQQEFAFLTGGNVHSTVTLEDSFAVSYWSKYTLTT